MAQRTASQSREARKKLWEGAKKEQKAFKARKTFKKLFIREKER